VKVRTGEIVLVGAADVEESSAEDDLSGKPGAVSVSDVDLVGTDGEF
jgi:hypothetical protein